MIIQSQVLPAVTLDVTSIFCSDSCLTRHHINSCNSDFCLLVFVQPDMPQADTHIKVSLRSIDGFDTSKICEALGGGGHAAASSCIVPQLQLRTWEALALEAGNGVKQQLGAELAGVIDGHVGQQ